uniref:Uncharacterized protein n=1 Tax=Arundo donax TaxID=35708 RepID=A0A0A9F0N5_ARUDO
MRSVPPVVDLVLLLDSISSLIVFGECFIFPPLYEMCNCAKRTCSQLCTY